MCTWDVFFSLVVIQKYFMAAVGIFEHTESKGIAMENVFSFLVWLNDTDWIYISGWNRLQRENAEDSNLYLI